MVYGELGRFPSELQTKIKMICFWYKLVASENQLSDKLYQLLITSSGSNKFKWINYVKSILDDTSFSNIWNSQQNITIIFFGENYRKAKTSRPVYPKMVL